MAYCCEQYDQQMKRVIFGMIEVKNRRISFVNHQASLYSACLEE